MAFWFLQFCASFSGLFFDKKIELLKRLEGNFDVCFQKYKGGKFRKN